MNRYVRDYALGSMILLGTWFALIAVLVLANWAGIIADQRDWPAYLLGLAGIAAVVELYRRNGLRLRHALPAGIGILVVLMAIFGWWA